MVHWASVRVAIASIALSAVALPGAAAQQLPADAQDSTIVADSSLDGVNNCDQNAVGVSAWARARGAPTFASYSVSSSDTLVGRRVRPKLVTRTQRLYRTAIREGAFHRPNFAGHYRAFGVGCGSSCLMLFIVDERSGAVYEPPNLGAPLFRLDSRLMIYDGPEGPGEVDEDSLGRLKSYPVTYYEWDGARLVLRDSLDAAGWRLGGTQHPKCSSRFR